MKVPEHFPAEQPFHPNCSCRRMMTASMSITVRIAMAITISSIRSLITRHIYLVLFTRLALLGSVVAVASPGAGSVLPCWGSLEMAQDAVGGSAPIA